MQVPDDFANELRKQILSLGQHEKIPAEDLHRKVFRIAEQEWRDYICYLDAELMTLVRCCYVIHSSIIGVNIFGSRKRKHSLSTSTSIANPIT